jgi:hypothetical protein
MVSQCIICGHTRLHEIEAAVISGEAPVAVRKRLNLGVRPQSIDQHIRLCMIAGLVTQLHQATGGVPPSAFVPTPLPTADEMEAWLTKPAVAADLRATLARLDNAASRAAAKGTLQIETSALQGTLKGLEQRARLGGLDKPAAPAPGQG